MGALLNLRAPLAHMPASACVLSEQTVRSLADTNAVARKLRELGYRVVRQELAGQGGSPSVHIDSGAETDIGPLLQRAGAPSWHRVSGHCFGRVVLDGVVVTWERA